MKLTRNSFSAIAAIILLSTNGLAFAEGSSHHHDHNKGQNQQGSSFTAISLSTNLTGVSGFPGTGTMHYVAGVNGSTLQAKIQLPIDGTTILDPNTAAMESYALTVSNGSTIVALCTLNINTIDFTNNTSATPNVVANYQASVFENGATLTTNIGTCTDGTGTTTTLPALTSGNTVSVALIAATPTSPVLTGTLAPTVGHHHHH